ncbi:MAG: sarcosine oxidase subunit gamma family protein [Pseudomonadota bacterium]
MTPPVRRSPLEGRETLADPAGRARLEIRDFPGKLILRGKPDQVRAGVDKALGITLPEKSPETASGSSATLLWLSPDQWMVLTGKGEEAGVQHALAQALSGAHHQIADVTDYYTILALSGPRAREILMKLTMLDLHERAFKAGEVRGTLLMHTQAVLYQSGGDGAEGGPVFDIIVRWSMADYLWCLIAECGREFGLPEQVPVSGERLVV